MSADEFLAYLTQLLFVVIFVIVLVDAARRPFPTKVQTALFFGCASLVIAQSWITAALDLVPGAGIQALTLSLVMALPWLLLWLTASFTDVPRASFWGATAGLMMSIVALFVYVPDLPAWLTISLAVYFFGVSSYAAVLTLREARRSSGVTRRRLQAVAAGSGFLGLAILAAGLVAVLPFAPDIIRVVVQRPLTLAAVLAYFIGFATPSVLRRTWQEPELRAFLSRASRLPRLPDTAAIRRELEAGAASSLGAPSAAIGLWDEEARRLRFETEAGPMDIAPGETIGGRAFAESRPIISVNAVRDDPANAELYARYGAIAVLAAPIVAGERRLGVLTVFAPRAPVFAEDDLSLVELLADQAAVILESRALIDEAARVRAREEVVRLKDDFLSAAAHDLRTPLTSLVARAQLIERRARRYPDRPVDPLDVQRLVREAERLRDLVLELLDATRVEGGKLIEAREPVDLAQLAHELLQRRPEDRHAFAVEAEEHVVGRYDRRRLLQLLDNLVDNAVKYSPDGGEVRVRIWRENGEARLSVTDQGIGIPPSDLPFVFDRFHRSRNVDDRRFSGLGLGLYICRGIAEQHGGRLWAISAPGQGSTFHLSLPLDDAEGASDESGNGRATDDPGGR